MTGIISRKKNKFGTKLNKRDPDIFFSWFENVAADTNWADEDKTLLLQTVLIGNR